MDKIVDYSDADLTFYMPVFRDLEPARWALAHLRQHYNGRAIVASDGDFDPCWRSLESEFQVELHYGVKNTAYWCRGLHVEKMMRLFLMRPTKWLIKLDTDAGIHRRFQYLPAGHQCGTVQHSGDATSIQAGCVVLSREFCERSLASGFLTAPDFFESLISWCPASLGTHWDGVPHIAEDWVLGYLGERLGMPPCEFKEIRSTWRDYVPNPDRKFAVTHPCKAMRL
ncbi:hypothetical protein [Blastopirellula marina]|uniref:Nucleotide-diphospho-sugar transferase domain-containing protein n=1 Tax=Blastopirellula marina TaxID=124 RepID=A0A2S8GH95_9BACT|nr:hypothetical protein [Blastopirellula marina]PQO43813.1 hypothetical protein C5Y93_21745 [Blastopirellula marina]